MADTVINGIDYGPLAFMAGTWKGDRGMDVAPESDGSTERNPYYDVVTYTLAGDVSNADKQKLAILSYSQKVYRKSNDEQFHDQVGYWLWDAATNTLMNTFVIPRAVALVAAGSFDPAQLDGPGFTLTVEAEEGGDWGVVQSPFMRDNARTKSFTQTVEIAGDRMTYRETTVLDIYGRSFDHIDSCTLERV